MDSGDDSNNEEEVAGEVTERGNHIQKARHQQFPPAEKEVIVERVVEKVVERSIEVLPSAHAKQKRALEEYNQSVVEQRNRLGEELLERESAIQISEQGRVSLEKKLEALKAKVMNGFGSDAATGEGSSPAEGGANNLLEVEMARKERERRRLQAKLRAKKRKEAVLEAERFQAEQEKKEAEEELKHAREEAETAERRQVRYR